MPPSAQPTPPAQPSSTPARGSVAALESETLASGAVASETRVPPTTESACARSTQGGFASWLVTLSLVLVVAVLFAPAIRGDQVLSFRDATYWHYHTLQWTVEQWQAGRLPLWNDLMGLGVNWVGQGTTTVFYPGTWLLALPLGEFRQRYAVVLAVHLLLSGWGMLRLSRQLGFSAGAAQFAAVSFALSGPILVQHGNWPFLISAAWLPWALAGLWGAVVHRSRSAGLGAAVALALILLGGEPQAWVLWGLAAVGLIWARSRVLGSVVSQSDAAPARFSTAPVSRVGPGNPVGWCCLGHWSGDRGWRSVWSGSWPVALILFAALAAAAVQAWPLWEAANSSTRGWQDEPANVYQAWQVWRSGDPAAGPRIAAGLWGPASPGSQRDQALQFSQPPWQWSTLLAGNVLGTWRAQHARWDRHWLANDRIWNPTLYAGLITAVLVLAQLGGLGSGLIRRRRGWRSTAVTPDTDANHEQSENIQKNLQSNETSELVGLWLWGLLLVFGLASCGWYGLVWLWTELQAAAGLEVRTPSVGPQVGGVYALLTWVIPGFDQFRYPAKLWLLASIAWSLLSARQLTRLVDESPQSSSPVERRRVLLALVVVLLLLTVALGVCLSPRWIQFFFGAFQAAPLDPWLGQLQTPRALLEIHLSLFQSLAVGGLFWAWLCWRPRVGPSWWLAALCGLTVADLWISNGWLVQTVDQRVLVDGTVWDRSDSPYRADSVMAPGGVAQRRFLYDPDLMQQHRWQQMQSKWGGYWPLQSPEKLTWQALYSMRATGAPQFHLATGAPSLNAELTLEPRGSGGLREWVWQRLPELTESAGRELWHSYLRSQGVRYWLSWSAAKATTVAGPELVWTTLPNTPPPVWLARSWEVRPPPSSLRRADGLRDLGQVWSRVLPPGAAADTGSVTIVDCPDPVVVDRPVTDWEHGPGRADSAAGLVSPASETQETRAQTVGTTDLRVSAEANSASGLIDWRWTDNERSAEVRSGDPAILVWRQQYDPGWWAMVSQSDGAWRWQRTFPVQRYLTGVAVGPGQSHVQLIYWPTWWWLGGGLSLLTWCCLLSLACRWARVSVP